MIIHQEDGPAAGSGKPPRKVLTGKYNMEQLKKITEFDTWVDDELEKLCPKGKLIEVDFEEWDSTEPPKRKEYLEKKLGTVVPDSPARKKFVEEYSKRGTIILALVHEASLKKTLSGSKLV
jgi:hypothetical protein